MNPLQEFWEEVLRFAQGRKQGIRNPFVIVPIEPSLEKRVADDLESRTRTHDGSPPIEVIHLDRIMPRTDVFQTVTSVPQDVAASTPEDTVETTLKENLGTQVIETIVQDHPEAVKRKEQVLLLLNLGSLHPFTRASELLDELDRLNVQATIGIPFPGQVLGGKLSFFGENARHYYPAHRPGEDDEQVREVHLQ